MLSADTIDVSEKNERPTLELVPTGEPTGEFPRTFGNYLLLSPLGQGGMGDVYLAKHGGIAGIEKHCVLKTLRPQFTDDREYVSRFIDEARVVVQLSHKNICSVFDVGNVDGRYYLAMEYIAGNDLRSLTTALAGMGEKLDLGVALHVVNEVLEALDYAHRHVDPSTGESLRLVHRDISPQNVMVSFEGEVKLIDFGLAASTLKLERTEPNVVMGKVAYMSPEQVRGDVVDGRTDLFAVGVMLYELLAHERYYEGKSPYEIWALAGTGTFKPRKWNELPADLREIISRALAPNRDDRYATCGDMREALEGVRMQRALRGSTVALRQAIEHAMPAEISESRARLAKFKNVKLLRTTTTPPTAPTVAAKRADPESTETVRNQYRDVVAPPSRKAALFAAAGLAGALVAVAVVLAVRPSTPPAPPPAPPVPVADAPAATTTTAPPPPAATTTPAPPAATTADAHAEAHVEEHAAPKPKSHVAPARRDPPRAAAASATTTPSTAHARAAGPVEEALSFKKRCPHAACAVALSQMVPDLRDHSGDTAWLRRWNTELKTCRATCR